MGCYGQSAFDAEVWALMEVLHAAEEAESDVHFVIDNSTVVGRFRSTIKGQMKFLPKNGFGIWVLARRLCKERDHRVMWTPSHGKQAGKWKPPDDLRTEGGYRRINAAADQQATLALNAYKVATKPFLDNYEAADKWTRAVLTKLADASYRWDEAMCESEVPPPAAAEEVQEDDGALNCGFDDSDWEPQNHQEWEED